MSTDMIKVRALQTQQGKNKVFSFFINGPDIFKIADISRVARDEKGNLKGLQRKPIQKHISGIAEYLMQENVIFPNAIILGLDPSIEFKQSRGPVPTGVLTNSEIGVLEIPILPEGERLAWIVDGQQRSTALSKVSKKMLNVPVVGFYGHDNETLRSQFILVNKAKPLPRNFIDELLPEINLPMPGDLVTRKIPSVLVNLLNSTKSSPLYGMIKRPSDPPKSKGVITDTALIKVAENSLNNYGALALYKGFGTKHDDVNGMFELMSTFWACVREVFPKAWGLPPTESRLMHSAGIQAMGLLMDRIVSRYPKDDQLKNNIKTSLRAIEKKCRWTGGQWEELGMNWNDIQSVPRHIRMLSDYLVQIDYVASGGKN